MTSVQDYSLTWSEGLIRRVEVTLRSLHKVLHEWYEQEGYPVTVPLRVLKASESGVDGQTAIAGEDDGETTELDVVSPAGSFHLRTSVHVTPYPDDHYASGIGVDLVLTIPEEVCSEKDLYEGRYLECRAAFLQKVKGWLEKVQVVTQAKASRNSKKQQNEEEEEDDAEEEELSHAVRRLGRMDIVEQPIHRCFGASEKSILCIRFRRSTQAAAAPHPYETVYLNLHFRPAVHTARATGHKVVRKHPLYSYLVLEDYLMPVHLRRLHKFCVAYPSLRRAVVLLKCWAQHVGLHAPSSGHSEGLNGFIIAAMVLHLTEAGILTPGMSEEAAARSVLRQISTGYFRSPPAPVAGSTHRLPAVEEKGEACVLHLQGETINVLFRSSPQYFQMAVETAAAEALADASLPLIEFMQQLPFLPLHLRFGVHLEVTGYPALHPSDAAAGGSSGLQGSSQYVSPAVARARRIRTVAMTAMCSKATDLTVCATGPESVDITIQLVSEAEGRSRLTRGPLIEDTEAVEAFNSFWGVERTSTRQFPDGSIHRCVLWEGVESATATTTQVVQHVLQYALQRHRSDVCVDDDNEDDSPSAAITVQPFLGQLEPFLYEELGEGQWRDAVPVVYKSLRVAWTSLHKMVAELPKRSLPCVITTFDTISPSERMMEAFPVRPSLALLSTSAAAIQSSGKGGDGIPPGLSLSADVEPVYCVLTIDDKGKIPDSVEAIGVMKAAIGAQLAKILESTYAQKPAADEKKKEHQEGSGATSAPAPQLTAFGHPHGVDVVYQGYLFRIFVAHYREVSLMRALQMNTQADLLEQKLFWSVQHTHFLRSVAFGHSTFPTAVRLAKRWVSAMCLYEFVLPEAIELIVAHAYLHERAPPLNAVAGFYRFLEILSTHDWKGQPLVLPSSEAAAATAASAAAGAPVARREDGMTIYSPYAPTDSPFTRSTPRPMVLHRLVALAAQALGLILLSLRRQHQQGLSSVERQLFTTDPSVFDGHIVLESRGLLLHRDRALQPSSSSAGAVVTTDPQSIRRIWQWDELQPEERRAYLRPRIEYNPAAQLVRAVRAALRDKAMVFYDTLGPTVLHFIALTPHAPRSIAVVKELARVACEASRGVLQMSMVAFSSAVMKSAEARRHAAAPITAASSPHRGQQGRKNRAAPARQEASQREEQQEVGRKRGRVNNNAKEDHHHHHNGHCCHHQSAELKKRKKNRASS